MKNPYPGRIVRRRALEGTPFARLNLDGISQGVIPAPIWNSLGTFGIDTTDRILSLTYDDGPHREHTPRILDALAAHDARATFFVLDGPARSHPEILRRIVAEGHEIALHGPDHNSLLTVSTTIAMKKIRTSRELIEELSGTAVSLYRPPYGRHTTAQARAITSLGLELAIWSGDAVDWIHDEEEAIAKRALGGVHPGAVLLLHDDRGDLEQLQPGEPAPRFDRSLVLRYVLERLEAEGFTSLTMSELLKRGPRIRTIARERTRL